MLADPLNSLSGRRLLVTGASGFIGSRLCRRAVELGAVVHGLSRRPPADGDVRWERGDLTDDTVADEVIRRIQPELVLHLASEVHGRRDLDLVVPTLRMNLLAAVNVMLACAKVGCSRLVLAGSMEEPDAGDPDAIPQSPYAVAKWAAFAYARPGQVDLNKLVPYVTVSLLRGEQPKLTSGEREVDWVYVDDVVDAFLRAAVAPGLEGLSLDIGTGELVTTRELVTRLHRIVGTEVEPVFGAIPDRPLERVRMAQPAAAAEAMGWHPEMPLDEGLARTVSFYREQVAGRGGR
jgi:UDP-glucose 4-epimerase